MRVLLFFTIAFFSTHLMAMKHVGEKLSIIGGGIAGSYASHLLKRHHPLLITKEKDLGGKCSSAMVDNHAFDHGAIQVPAYYHRVRAMVDKLNLTLIPSPDARSLDGSSPFWATLKTYGLAKSIKDFATYAYHAWFYNDLTAKPCDVSNHPSVQTSVEDYLKGNSMEAVTPIFNIVLKNYGYGELNTIPMFHAFSIVPAQQILYSLLSGIPYINQSMPTSIDLIKEGYQRFVNEMVVDSNVRTRKGQRVQQIDLRDWKKTGSATITFDNGEKLDSKKIILCTLPSDVEIIYADFKKQKLIDELRQSLVTSPYATAIFETNAPLPHDLMVDNNSISPFNPVMIGRKFPDKNIYIGYIYGQKKDEMDMRIALKRYAHRHFNENCITIHSFKTFDDYYPHPTFKAIAEGYYSKMESLQGDSGLYFAGSHLSFEIIERTMENVEELIKNHFNR